MSLYNKKSASERGKLGVQKRRENIMAQGRESVCVGEIIFRGPLFGNAEHIIRCLTHEDREYLLREIDGVLYTPVTLRGLKRIIADRIWK